MLEFHTHVKGYNNLFEAQRFRVCDVVQKMQVVINNN